MVGSAELRKRKHEDKTRGNRGELFECLFLSRLPHYPKAWNRLITGRLPSLYPTSCKFIKRAGVSLLAKQNLIP